MSQFPREQLAALAQWHEDRGLFHANSAKACRDAVEAYDRVRRDTIAECAAIAGAAHGGDGDPRQIRDRIRLLDPNSLTGARAV